MLDWNQILSYLDTEKKKELISCIELKGDFSFESVEFEDFKIAEKFVQ